MCVLLQVVHTKFIPMVELKLNVNTLFYVTLQVTRGRRNMKICSDS